MAGWGILNQPSQDAYATKSNTEQYNIFLIFYL